MRAIFALVLMTLCVCAPPLLAGQEGQKGRSLNSVDLLQAALNPTMGFDEKMLWLRRKEQSGASLTNDAAWCVLSYLKYSYPDDAMMSTLSGLVHNTGEPWDDRLDSLVWRTLEDRATAPGKWNVFFRMCANRPMLDGIGMPRTWSARQVAYRSHLRSVFLERLNADSAPEVLVFLLADTSTSFCYESRVPPDKELLNRIRDLLEHHDVGVRRAALSGLRRFGISFLPGDTIPPLVSLCKSSDRQTRQGAAELLSAITRHCKGKLPRRGATAVAWVDWLNREGGEFDLVGSLIATATDKELAGTRKQHAKCPPEEQRHAIDRLFELCLIVPDQEYLRIVTCMFDLMNAEYADSVLKTYMARALCATISTRADPGDYAQRLTSILLAAVEARDGSISAVDSICCLGVIGRPAEDANVAMVLRRVLADPDEDAIVRAYAGYALRHVAQRNKEVLGKLLELAKSQEPLRDIEGNGRSFRIALISLREATGQAFDDDLDAWGAYIRQLPAEEQE